MKELLKKPWTWAIGAIAVLLALFKWEKSKRVSAEAALETAETAKKDAVLEQKQKDIVSELAKDTAELEAEKAKKLTAAEMAEYLKKL